MSGDVARVAYPLFQEEDGGSNPTSPLHARDLTFNLIDKSQAVRLNRLWHSRLPKVQEGPWQYAFCATFGKVIYAVALWHNPSARMLPHHWLELRRMAIAPDAPKYTASRFLQWMVRYFRKTCPNREKCISYQDPAVHHGTIYKASGWTIGYISKPITRDRSKNRVGTNRKYRSNLNGNEVAASPKIRWEKDLR